MFPRPPGPLLFHRSPMYTCVMWPSACLKGKMKVDWESYVVGDDVGLKPPSHVAPTSVLEVVVMKIAGLGSQPYTHNIASTIIE